MTVKIENIWRVGCVSGSEAIHDLKSQWLSLEAQNDNPYACFQGYAWCHAWAQTWCGKDSSFEPRIFLFYRSDKLVGLLPMMVSSVTGVRILSILGAPHTQTADILAASGVDLTAGLKVFYEQAPKFGVDVITLNAVPDNSALAKFWGNKMSPDPAEHMAITHRGDNENSRAYYKSISRNRKRDFSRKLRRLESLGKVSHKTIPISSADFPLFAKEAIEMKRRWLKEKRTISSGLSWKNMTEFVQRLNNADGRYRCEVQTLSIDNVPAAISINLVGAGMRSCYLSAYDLSLNDASPGTVMHQLSIQQSIDEGLQGYNFLGHPTYFKTLWANKQMPLLRHQLPLSWKGRLWVGLWSNRIKPLTKQLLGRTGKSA